MAYGKHVLYDTLRELAFGSIAAGFTAVGSSMTHEARMLFFINSTDKDLYLSVDNSTNFMRIAAGSTQVHEYCTNRVSEDGFFVAIGTQYYVKQTEAGAPSKGSMAILTVYASPIM